MQNIIRNHPALITRTGSSLEYLSAKAKKIAIDNNAIVCFEFHGKEIFVNKNTNFTDIHRDFTLAFIMNWKSIGVACLEDYSENLKLEIDKARDTWKKTVGW